MLSYVDIPQTTSEVFQLQPPCLNFGLTPSIPLIMNRDMINHFLSISIYSVRKIAQKIMLVVLTIVPLRS